MSENLQKCNLTKHLINKQICRYQSIYCRI